MQGQMNVKELIDQTDLINFLYGIERSKLRNGNLIIVDWLATSFNIKNKMKKIFHGAKYKLG